MSNALYTKDAPEPIGPYSQAIVSGDYVFCSGQVPIDPSTGELVSGDITAQSEQVFKNIAAVLRAAGASFADVVKTTVFLIDMNDFGAMNAVYGTHFNESKPARSTIAVAALPKGARVEIEVIVKKP